MGESEQSSFEVQRPSEPISISGKVEDISENPSFRGLLTLQVNDGRQIQLRPGSDVEGVSELSNKYVVIFGVLEEGDEDGKGVITVLGYRILPPPAPRGESEEGHRPILKNRAA